MFVTVVLGSRIETGCPTIWEIPFKVVTLCVMLYFPVSDSCDLAGHVFQSAPNQIFGVRIVNCTTFLTPFF